MKLSIQLVIKMEIGESQKQVISDQTVTNKESIIKCIVLPLNTIMFNKDEYLSSTKYRPPTKNAHH